MNACVLVLACLPTSNPLEEFSWRLTLGKVGKLDYECRITDSMLDRTPAWAADREHPPLAARKALAAADRVLEDLLKGHPRAERSAPREGWRLRSLDLTPTNRPGRWMWLARYEAVAVSARADAEHEHLTIPVFMDGTAVRPTALPGSCQGPPLP